MLQANAHASRRHRLGSVRLLVAGLCFACLPWVVTECLHASELTRVATSPLPGPPTSALHTRLASHHGQPVLINFWASWCAPCRAEMPELVDAFQQHKDQGLVVIGVNQQESEDKALQFMQEFGIEFPVALDSRGDLASLYVARGLPTTYFIDRDGNIAEQWRGLLTADLLQERLAPLLEQ